MSTAVRYGVQVASWPLGPPETPDYYKRLAQHVEAAGFDLFFAGDHLFTHNPFHEALTVLSYVAGATSRLTVGTGVLLLALREPVVAAKQLATLDSISGGRLVVGVGVGGEIEQEWNAMGVPLDERGARTDESLALLGQLWSGEPVRHHGRFWSIDGVTGSPLPTRHGGPPIWIGGRSDAALRRAARHDGWCAYACSPSRVRTNVERLTALGTSGPEGIRISMVLFCCVDNDAERARTMAAEGLGKRYQQDFDHFLDAFCAVGTADQVADRVREYIDAGVQDVLFLPQVPAESMFEQVDRLEAVTRTLT